MPSICNVSAVTYAMLVDELEASASWYSSMFYDDPGLAIPVWQTDEYVEWQLHHREQILNNFIRHRKWLRQLGPYPSNLRIVPKGGKVLPGTGRDVYEGDIRLSLLWGMYGDCTFRGKLILFWRAESTERLQKKMEMYDALAWHLPEVDMTLAAIARKMHLGAIILQRTFPIGVPFFSDMPASGPPSDQNSDGHPEDQNHEPPHGALFGSPSPDQGFSSERSGSSSSGFQSQENDTAVLPDAANNSVAELQMPDLQEPCERQKRAPALLSRKPCTSSTSRLRYHYEGDSPAGSMTGDNSLTAEAQKSDNCSAVMQQSTYNHSAKEIQGSPMDICETEDKYLSPREAAISVVRNKATDPWQGIPVVDYLHWRIEEEPTSKPTKPALGGQTAGTSNHRESRYQSLFKTMKESQLAKKRRSASAAFHPATLETQSANGNGRRHKRIQLS